MHALKEQPAATRSLKCLPLRAQLPAHKKHLLSLNSVQPPGSPTERSGKFKNILVPTDFSACSAEAVSRATELARHHQATLTILHVVDINSPSAFTHGGTAEDLMRQLWRAGISGLRRLTESLAQTQIKIQTRIIEGLPAEVIVENSSSFDCLVISERHPKSAWNFFSTHTAQRVIEQAECPVLVVQGVSPGHLCTR